MMWGRGAGFIGFALGWILTATLLNLPRVAPMPAPSTTSRSAPAAYVWPFRTGMGSWEVLHQHPEIVGDARARIAAHGLLALERARGSGCPDLATLSYQLRLLVERADAQRTEARAVDLYTADRLRELVVAIVTARRGRTSAPGG